MVVVALNLWHWSITVKHLHGQEALSLQKSINLYFSQTPTNWQQHTYCCWGTARGSLCMSRSNSRHPQGGRCTPLFSTSSPPTYHPTHQGRHNCVCVCVCVRVCVYLCVYVRWVGGRKSYKQACTCLCVSEREHQGYSACVVMLCLCVRVWASGVSG